MYILLQEFRQKPASLQAVQSSQFCYFSTTIYLVRFFMKRISKLILKKKRGVGDMLVCVLSIVILSFILLMSIDAYRNMSLAIEKKNIERKYILLLETQGFLTTDNQKDLINDLKRIGVSDIKIESDTPLESGNHAGYGQTVVLHVTGKITYYARTGLDDGWTWRGGYPKNDFTIYQKSTAKY